MVYLDNNTNQQEVWIPRNDGVGATHKNIYTLEGVNVSISADTTTVTPSSGFYGMSAVTIDASNYAQQNYEGGFEDGYQDGFMSGSSEGFESGYTSGHADGVNEEKAKMSAVTFTANTTVTLSDGSYSAVTVDVPQTGYTQQDLDNAFASGETVGENTIIATFSSTTATTNGQYGSTAHPLSSITVNVPQTGSSYNVELNKPFTATSEGTYTIKPSEIWSITYDHTFARRYVFTINGTIPQSFVNDTAYIISYYDENTGEEPSVRVEIGSGNTLYLNKNNWDEDDYGDVDFYLYQGKYRLDFDDDLVDSEFSITQYSNKEKYDVMSAVTLNVSLVGIHLVDYVCAQEMTDYSNYTDGIKLGNVWTTNTEFRIKGIMTGNQTGNGVLTNYDGSGYAPTRWFWCYGNMYYDFNSDRIDTPFTSVSGTAFDYTISNWGVYDNLTETYVMSGTPKMSVSVGVVWLNMRTCKISSIEVKQGNNVIINGLAAYDDNNNIGLYDTISKTMLYNSGLPMTYGSVLDPSYASGYTDGQNSIISTFTAVTATTNGVYGSTAHPLSSITVNITGTTSNRTELEYLSTTGDTWFVLDHQFQASESVEIKKATISNEGFMFEHYSYIDGGGGWYPNNEWPRIGFSDLGMYYSYYDDNKVYLNVTGVTDSTILMTKDGFWVDGVQLTARTFTETAQKTTDLVVFANNPNGGNVVGNQTASIGKITIYGQDDTVVAQYIPCLDSGNTVCFYNPISDTYIYKSVNCNGTPIAGPVAPSEDYLSGYTDGYASGFTDGYNSGYTDGFASGSSQGFIGGVDSTVYGAYYPIESVGPSQINRSYKTQVTTFSGVGVTFEFDFTNLGDTSWPYGMFINGYGDNFYLQYDSTESADTKIFRMHIDDGNGNVGTMANYSKGSQRIIGYVTINQGSCEYGIGIGGVITSTGSTSGNFESVLYCILFNPETKYNIVFNRMMVIANGTVQKEFIYQNGDIVDAVNNTTATTYDYSGNTVTGVFQPRLVSYPSKVLSI